MVLSTGARTAWPSAPRHVCLGCLVLVVQVVSQHLAVRSEDTRSHVEVVTALLDGGR